MADSKPQQQPPQRREPQQQQQDGGRQQQQDRQAQPGNPSSGDKSKQMGGDKQR